MKELEEFSVFFDTDTREGIAAVDLTKEEACSSFLKQQMQLLQAPNIAEAASMISKRYAYLIATSTVYSMITYNQALSLPLHACSLSSSRSLFIQKEHCHWSNGEQEREKWRERVLQQLFAEHLTPVLNTLNRVSRLPASILWENVVVRLHSVYRDVEKADPDPLQRERLIRDFAFLKSAPGSLFGLDQNPIAPYLKIGEERTANPYRKTCCLYYKLGENKQNGVYCRVCPLSKNKDSRIK